MTIYSSHLVLYLSLVKVPERVRLRKKKERKITLFGVTFVQHSILLQRHAINLTTQVMFLSNIIRSTFSYMSCIASNLFRNSHLYKYVFSDQSIKMNSSALIFQALHETILHLLQARATESHLQKAEKPHLLTTSDNRNNKKWIAHATGKRK